MKLRDRDSIVTKEGLIFRVFGYSHPSNAYICDAEYASSEIFKSSDPRAPRDGAGKSNLFYKFYDDEGWKFIHKNYPRYAITHEMLGVTVLGVNRAYISEVREPSVRLKELVAVEPADKLHAATLRVLNVSLKRSGLSVDNFGVFGSILHGFHHPDYSDIDLIIYGRRQIEKMRQALEVLYAEHDSGFRNEFETDAAIAGKKWRFKNFTPKEFLWHQKRKFIYALYDDKAQSGRVIKAEFEPVKKWKEIKNEYNPQTKIVPKDWVRIKARITEDVDAPFIPSVYSIEPLEVLSGSRTVLEATRVISYLEEFRQQVQKDETVIVEGNLEEVVSTKGSFHQIALTYCPRYYEQTLKVANLTF
ncbi:MAG: nucleotidyltransferase domain-containing protein [Candidatus Bathyarchaeota archaeon]|nr:nucleotidyltransferase domain-containing protein [Candidatus Bathyarchaeota archaeon]